MTKRILPAVPLVVLLLAGCGHQIYRAPNHRDGRFDFADPPCAAVDDGPLAQGEVGVRYLGSGGVAVEWGGAALLVGPYFSNYGLPRVVLGRVAPDRDAIGRGLARVPVDRVAAILVGHSHHDHLADVPVVAADYATRARIFVNDSGVNLLAPWRLGDRVESVERRLGEWIDVAGPDGAPLPIRFLAVRTEHAPIVCHYHFRPKQVGKPLGKKPEDVRVWDFQMGTPMAFVIDLLSPDRREVRFRLYYQDAAAHDAVGAPPVSVLADGRGVDLAVLCAASYNWVDGAPEGILKALQPRHVLVSHYDDFFSSRRRAERFVPLLTDRLANSYLRRVDAAFGSQSPPARKPAGEVCGPSGDRWTLPLVGERLRFVPPGETPR